MIVSRRKSRDGEREERVSSEINNLQVGDDCQVQLFDQWVVAQWW